MADDDPISWSTAQKVSARVAKREPFSSSYLAASFESDMVELTKKAEQLVEAETGLVADGLARVRVVDRAAWAHANIKTFQRLLAPLTDRLGEKMATSRFAVVGRKATGTQMGLVLGWMSTRVLGQYDLLLRKDLNPEDQDFIYYVGPNILELEKRFAFPPREFRLWIAVHECTHRAQFTGVPWLPEYFRTQVETLLDAVDADSDRINEVLGEVKDKIRSGENPLADGGLMTLMATPEQKAAMERILGLMSLLEGHGEVVMSRAGGDLIPSAERFHRVLAARRKKGVNPVGKVMQRVLGMDKKMRQYAEGAKFIEQIEKAGGAELFNQIWRTPEDLPSYDEIKKPELWIERHSVATTS